MAVVQRKSLFMALQCVGWVLHDPAHGPAPAQRSLVLTAAARTRSSTRPVQVVNGGKREVKVDHVMHVTSEVKAACRHVCGDQHGRASRTGRGICAHRQHMQQGWPQTCSKTCRKTALCCSTDCTRH